MDKTIQKFFDDILGEKHEVSPALTEVEPLKTEPKLKEVKSEAAIVVKPVLKKVDPKLAAYVAEELKQGVPPTDIKKILLKTHWPEKDVDAALNASR